MFTGLVTHKVTIIEINDGTFTVDNVFTSALKVGQSIAHDGACMTVSKTSPDTYSFFVMNESLEKSTLANKKAGDYLNIEFPATLGTALDGHLVTGHIDTTGTILSTSFSDDKSMMLEVSFDPSFDQLVIPKGSITLNGVSLTVVDVGKGSLTVRLIPITQTETNLGALQIGDFINIEFDIIGKYTTKRGREGKGREEKLKVKN